jgi:fructosamine-3-kinase
MIEMSLLMERLRAVGLPAESVVPASGGVVALAGLATMDDGSRVFAKTLAGPGSDLFETEAEGLRALAELGGATTPEIRLVTPNLLVLTPLHPRPATEYFWERAGHMLAAVHTTAIGDRFGWHRDGWLGRLRQDNTWTADGHEFFAQRRLLRWLSEPLVDAALDREDRHALERLCAVLPEVVPAQPPVLNHGDLWSGNIMAAADGGPVFIDPAVSYTWAESDLSMMWGGLRPPEADRFFTAYAEMAPLHDGWQDRMPLLHLREWLSTIAHDDDDWGAAAAVRKATRGVGAHAPARGANMMTETPMRQMAAPRRSKRSGLKLSTVIAQRREPATKTPP